MRHSSKPAIAVTFLGDICLAVAARDVEEGEELTTSLVDFRFHEQTHLAQLRAAGIDACDWPEGFPPRGNSQMTMVRNFFGQAEAAAWGDDEDAQEEAAAKLKNWFKEFGGIGLLRTSARLRLRLHALAMHLWTGRHRLDDAWDAASEMLDILPQVPLSEAGELCVSIALLGGALAYQQEQHARARKLFDAAAALLSYLMGSGGCRDSAAWESWLRTFVPPPLLKAALDAWWSTDTVAPAGPPGLGRYDDAKEEATSEIHGATNMELWEAESVLLELSPSPTVTPAVAVIAAGVAGSAATADVKVIATGAACSAATANVKVGTEAVDGLDELD